MNIANRSILSCATALLLGCATATTTTQPARIIDVDRDTYFKKIPYPEFFREEFYVVWQGANITLVKFEYRQLKFPNEIFAKSYVPTKRPSHVFEIPSADFLKGGHVSAWRVTLWQDDKIVDEKKSALW